MKQVIPRFNPPDFDFHWSGSYAIFNFSDLEIKLAAHIQYKMFT